MTVTQSVATEEAALRGVLARAFLDTLGVGASSVGVVLDRAAYARRAVDHLAAIARSLGIFDFRTRLTSGAEEFEVGQGCRILFFNRRSVHRSIRGYSLSALYVPSGWLTPDLEGDILPALATSPRGIEIY